MINNKFNSKFRKLLSVSCLVSLCCSQVIYADGVDFLRSTSQEFRKELYNRIADKSRARRLVRRARAILDYDGNFSPDDIGEPLGKGTEHRNHAKYTQLAGVGAFSFRLNEFYYGVVYQDETLSSPIKFILLKVDDKIKFLPYNKTIRDTLRNFFTKRSDLIFAMKDRETKEKTTDGENQETLRYKKEIEKLKIPNDIEKIAWTKGSKYFKKYLMQVLDSKTSKIIKYGVPSLALAGLVIAAAHSKFKTHKS